MLPGRNDLCYCGSGKKYKNCCMEKDLKKERHARRLNEANKQYAELYTKIYEYSRRDEFIEEYKRAEEIFYIVNSNEVKIKFEKFFETFYMQDHITESGKVIATRFYNEFEKKLTDNEKRILQSIGNSYVSVYDVVKTDSESVTLKDCFTGMEITTEDTKLLEGFEVGSSLIARAIEVSGVTLLIDITVKIVSGIRDFILNDMNRLYKKYESDCQNMRLFLSYHTYIFYRYIQQLLDESCAKAMKEESEKNSNEDDEASVISLLEKNVEAESVEKSVSTWKKLENLNAELKGSESGWAAAIEYFVKKEDGVSVTQAQISKKYGISPSTLGKRFKEIKEALN